MSTSPTRGGAATATAATPTNSAAASAARQLAAVTATASAEVQQALADYAVGRVLGKGKFSQVYLVTSRTSGRKFAFKVLSKVDHRPRVMAKLRREIEILHALRDAKVYIPCAAAAPTEATAMAASAHRRGHGHGGGRRPRLPRVDSAGSGSGSVVPGNWPSIPLDEDLAIASSRRQHHSESLATLHEQTHMCASDASENGDNDSDESECSDDDDDDSVEPATLRGHPNLVTLHQAFETPSSTILLLEYIAGINLHDFVFESIRLSEGVARGLFRQLVSATSFCHARGVVHRDLKMGNVMLILAQPPTPVYSPPPQASSSMTLSGGSSHHLPSDNMQQQQQQPPHSPRRGSEPAVQYNGGAGSSSANGRSPATPRHWPRRLELTRSYRLKFRSAIVASPVGEDQYEMVRDPCSGRSWMEQEIAESGGWLVKLVDFGLGSSFDPQEYRHTAVGSPGYFSPEIALGAEYVGPEVDVWSLGVVLFEMTTGMHPFSAKDLPTLKEIVVRGRFAVPPHVSPDLRRTFHRMMVTDPRRRRNLHVLDHDAWTNAGYGAHAPAAYSDPPEDALVAAGVPDLTDGTVVMVDDGVLLAEAEGLVASPPAVAGTLGAPTSTDRRRSLSSPATAVDAIAAGYGRPRAGTARTAPGSATAAAAVAAAGPWVGGTASESAPGFYGAADDEMTVRRHELARRLRTFNASVPALAQYGISVPNGGQRAYHGVPAASSPSRGASSGDTGVVRRSHSRSRSSGSTARRTSVVETAALMMAGGVAPTFEYVTPAPGHTASGSTDASPATQIPLPPTTPRRGSAPAIHSPNMQRQQRPQQQQAAAGAPALHHPIAASVAAARAVAHILPPAPPMPSGAAATPQHQQQQSTPRPLSAAQTAVQLATMAAAHVQMADERAAAAAMRLPPPPAFSDAPPAVPPSPAAMRSGGGTDPGMSPPTSVPAPLRMRNGHGTGAPPPTPTTPTTATGSWWPFGSPAYSKSATNLASQQQQSGPTGPGAGAGAAAVPRRGPIGSTASGRSTRSAVTAAEGFLPLPTGGTGNGGDVSPATSAAATAVASSAESSGDGPATTYASTGGGGAGGLMMPPAAHGMPVSSSTGRKSRPWYSRLFGSSKGGSSSNSSSSSSTGAGAAGAAPRSAR